MRNAPLIFRLDDDVSRLCKVWVINTAGEGVNRVMLLTLRFVETLAAGKDQVGALKDFRFAFAHVSYTLLTLPTRGSGSL